MSNRIKQELNLQLNILRYEACYIKDIKDVAKARRTITNFVNRQGDDLVGGVVLRNFERHKQIGCHPISGMPLSEEYRVYILSGNILIIDDYWSDHYDLSFTDEEMDRVKSFADKVSSNFVTMDLARAEDGTLIIMEFGDGQVSGLQQIPATLFYKSITDTLNRKGHDQKTGH
ncbi:MAG: ATP-grasp domain-containing protein [Erysipelotrichaceae bacterium]|nr:ATP-grasp domain-containing protein [Erysipelotrichaceae bacterium]